MDNTTTIDIEAATAGDLPGVLALLAASQLPPAGLRDHLASALVARQQGRLVGSAALELYGRLALLRSVAVAPAVRAQGLGAQLTRAALDLARQHGVAEVYLLAETAAGYFSRFGFQPIARATVAAPVQQSLEFSSACCASAQAMRLNLQSMP